MDSVAGDDSSACANFANFSSSSSLPNIESLVLAHVQQRLHATQQHQLLLQRGVHIPLSSGYNPQSFAAKSDRPGTPMVQQSPFVRHAYSSSSIANPPTSLQAHVSSLPSRLNVAYSPPAMLTFEHPPPDGFHRDLLRPPDATDAEVERNLRSSEEAHARLMALRRCQSLSPPGIVQSAFETRCQSLTDISTSVESNSLDSMVHPAPLAPLTHSTDVTNADNDDAADDQLTGASGKLMVTDLDQESVEGIVTRVSHRESPVPDLIDDTR